MSALAGVKPVPLPQLAVTAGVAPGFVQTFLERHPRALLTSDGWIDALTLFDGVWFIHELSEAERDVGLLSADDAVAVLAVLATQGLPLGADAAGAPGEVVGKALPDLPPRLAGDLPAGQGLIGQALVGPAGGSTRTGPEICCGCGCVTATSRWGPRDRPPSPAGGWTSCASRGWSPPRMRSAGIRTLRITRHRPPTSRG